MAIKEEEVYYTDQELNYEILIRLGIRVPPFTRDFMCKCPLHKDNRPSMGINLDKNVYHCFSCGDKGSLFNLYRKATGTDILSDLKGKRRVTNIFARINTRYSMLNYEDLPETKVGFHEDHVVPISQSIEAMEYLSKRGISIKTANDMGMRYSYKAHSFSPDNPEDRTQWVSYTNRLVIPIKEKDTKMSNNSTDFYRILSIEGRDILGKEEFERKKNFMIYRLSATLSNEDSLEQIDSLKKSVYKKVLYPKNSSTSTLFQMYKLDVNKPLYMVEGLMDLGVLREDPYFANSTAIFGASISQRQLYLLQKFKDIIYIADHDLAGLRSVKRFKEQFDRPFKILFAPASCKDVGDIPQILHTTVKDCRENRHWLNLENFISSSEFDFNEQLEKSPFITEDQRNMMAEVKSHEPRRIIKFVAN